MIDLDKRILDGKKPLTAFDEMNSKFIGTDCFFSDKPSDFADLSKCQVGKLMSLDAVSGMFGASKNNSYAVFYFCLPCEWVKPEKPEKKYRPYSLEEFFNILNVGGLIVFRVKNDDEVKCAMFTGYITDEERIDDKTPGACEVMLGIFHYSLFSLFEDFELFYHGKWQPFGIEE